jgi:thiol-disulfide isomerase/thioredoxin
METDHHTPEALLFIAPGCPHCPLVLQGLADLVKEGRIGRLEVVNVAACPQLAAEHGVRAAPWVRIGPFELEGALTPAALSMWAERVGSREGHKEYVRTLLKGGKLAEAERFVASHPDQIAALLPLLEDPAVEMQVRIGLSAVIEAQQGTEALRGIVPELGRLSRHADRRVRADACHLLGLSADPRAAAYLQERLGDEDRDVREIAHEALSAL